MCDGVTLVVLMLPGLLRQFEGDYIGYCSHADMIEIVFLIFYFRF